MKRKHRATSLAQRWADFDARCLPASAGPAQHTAMRLAFYAGATAFFGLIHDATTHDEAASVARLNALQEEINAFVHERREAALRTWEPGEVH